MIEFYHYLALINGVVSLAVAIAVCWKNRFQAIGPLFGVAMLILAVWMVAFSQYFLHLPAAEALMWAKVTVSAAILINPFLFHSICALVEKMRTFRWWIGAVYVLGVVFVVLLWQGKLVTGLRPALYMDHYIRYNRAWYPVLGAYIVIPQWAGFGILGFNARVTVGYKRTQLVYFIVAWLIVFLVTDSIIVPLEYDLSVPPFGFLVLPLNLAFLAYVMSRARLADFNVVIARVLLHSVTLVVVVFSSLLLIGGMTLVAPHFMNPQQILFTVMLVVVIGLTLAVGLPRFLPRAERMMQERMFGKRYGYQDALAGLVKELSLLQNVDEVLGKVATTLHDQMQLSRVLILMQDPLSGDYQLQAQSGLSQEQTEGLDLGENAPLVHWLQENRDALVRDELARRVPPQVVRELLPDLDRLKAAVCMPMILDNRLTGLIVMGAKLGNEMFFVSDLRLLETLTTEVALAVKYRRMEDQIFRKNKLIELGTIGAGIAHEIRNPLASIRTFAQLLPDQMDDPEFKGEFSKLVLKDVDRITKVVESMLAFARPSQVSIADHSANDLVDEAIMLAQPRLKSKQIELTKNFHEKPMIKVDKQQILQVLINLLNNAADALPEHGKIRVATGMRLMEGAEGNGNQQKFGVIEVADNGPGIPAATRNRLFDPFFTTKKEGTGLGLSISQKIARDHGGVITVSSVVGKGTTFQVNLPLS